VYTYQARSHWEVMLLFAGYFTGIAPIA